MPDYPAAVYRLAADAVEPDSPAAEAIARAVLDAVAEQLGQRVATAILRHSDEHEPEPGSRAYLAWHRHFGIAARVAAGAFLTEDDRRRQVAEALAAGNFVACPLPEDGSNEHGL